MKTKKCIIVDDEKYAQDVLIQYISQLASLDLISVCNNALEAFNVLHNQKIDLIFLDVSMPQLSGLELAKNISKETKVIFTTASAEHAIESYELNALDYLLKPITHERFLKSISRFFEIINENISIISTKVEETKSNPFIFLRVNRKNIKVFISDILYVQGLKDYVKVITEKENYITYLKLNYLEAKLSEKKFIRVHKSYIVSIDKVKSFTSLDIELENRREIPIGKSYQAKVLKILEKSRL